MKLKDILKGKLTEKEMSFLRSSYDILGHIAIVEISKELEKKEGIIAEAIMQINKNVKTVAKKSGFHEGEFRIRKVKIIGGEKTKETEYTENGVKLRFDIEKVYFSPRLSTERKRIANLVKKGESVLVMFSGCGPYVCVIAKNSKAKEVYGVEINPVGHKYAEENIRINKISNAKLFLGDVKKIVPKLNKKFDRIVMPLPRGAENFLYIALNSIKKNGTIHFYDFEHERDIPEKSIKKIENACKKAKKKFKVMLWRLCGQYGPRKFRVVVDFKVLN